MSAINSTFALLDVKKGRHALEKRLDDAPVPIVIRGFITRAWSRDDGTSTEFEVEVISVEETASLGHASIPSDPVPEGTS